MSVKIVNLADDIAVVPNAAAVIQHKTNPVAREARMLPATIKTKKAMANKRDFKKYVAVVGANVSEDMMIIRYCNPDMDPKVIDKCVGEVLLAVTKAVSDANRFFDKGVRDFESRKEYEEAKRAFFKELFGTIYADFTASISTALKEFNAAIPQQVKDANKANA